MTERMATKKLRGTRHDAGKTLCILYGDRHGSHRRHIAVCGARQCGVYDANGNLQQVTDRKNQVTSYSYDALNRLNTVTYQDSSTTTHTYDTGDRLTQVVDSIAGMITRGWDLLDRLTSETTPGDVRVRQCRSADEHHAELCDGGVYLR